ncbi:hypothetical protein L6164_037010 [Bauhinia variegata]|uniref:Uncharacterized protein n=1 Tax=Bauhinia variegata TaxID=167791 RepID=A0ACB9KIT9_BAUVA|nr:hypothetical protein L6164_037010 [Bauhinia variegata]
MKIHQMGSQPLFFFFFIFLLTLAAGTVYGDDLRDKCTKDVQKVIPCLSFAKGDAAVPTKECCSAATAIKESEPDCLCYIIQQTHKGSPESKSLGIQEARLLQLPSVCNIKNASITNCPKLLHLTPGSPDAAIFTSANSSSPATPSSPASSGTSGSTTGLDEKSYGSSPRSHPIYILAVAFVTVFLAIPTEFIFNI